MKINVEKSNVHEWLGVLGEASKGKHYPKLWKKVYKLVEVPARRRVEVNLSKIEGSTKEGDNVVVPGKVLSTGKIGHKVNIAAIEFSGSALKSLNNSGCKVVNIRDMLNEKKIHLIV